jgi:ferritin-like metal-binding protein YciE
MSISTVNDLFLHTLKDVYYAEKRILKGLPDMIEAVEHDVLREALEVHREQTEGQIERIEQVFGRIGKKPSAAECPAIDGILEEAEELLEETEDEPVADAAIIASAQAVEHYEIARYRSLVMWANQLGLPEAAELLQQSLDEEQAADDKLVALAAEAKADIEEPAEETH